MFDIDAARKAGVSDAQIEQYLTHATPNFDVQGALKAGASLDQIAKEVNNPSNKPTPPDPVQVAQNLQANTNSMNPSMPVPAPVQQTGNIPMMNENQVGNQIGQQTSEALAQRGVNPYVAAAAGMPAAMAAPTANAAYTTAMMGGPSGIADTLGSIGRGIASPVSSGVDKLRNLARIMTGPGEASQTLAMQPIRNAATGYVTDAQSALRQAQQIPQDLIDAKTALPDIQSKMAQLPSERAALVAKAGQNIQSLEKPLGPLDSKLIDDITSHPQVRSMMLQKMTELTSKGPDAVNEAMSAGEIRQMRQVVQEIARNPQVAIEAPQASQVNTVLGQAMDSHIPGYSDALDMYKTAQNALEDVPNVKAQQLGQLRSSIKDMESAFTNSKLDAADQLAKAKLNAQQIMQKADIMVQQGKLSDTYRSNLYKGIVATGILGGGAKIISKLGGQ